MLIFLVNLNKTKTILKRLPLKTSLQKMVVQMKTCEK
jgi:hypothetical protein